MTREKSVYYSVLINLLFFSSIVFTMSYVIFRTVYVIYGSTVWYDAFLASIFLFAEIFGLSHSLNYVITTWMILSRPNKKPEIPKLQSYPTVAVVLPSYHEPLEVIRENLICFYNLSYPNKHLYLLDDSRYDKPWDTEENVKKYRQDVEGLCRWLGVNLFRRKWRGAKAGIINDFINFRRGTIPENLEYLPFEKNPSAEPEKYFAVFDADMNPLPDFLDHLVARIEQDPKLAFVQTPQYYTNFETNRVARAAGLLQIIFYEYICEGKNLKSAMFCCGSNVLIRAEAFLSVGGFDETTVTEDFATSLKLHLLGWKSLYYNKVLGFGKGPEDLGGFFKQQFRWARGTVGLVRVIPKEIIKDHRKLPPGTWWEYWISSTHYFTGGFFFVMFLFPIMYIFFNTPTLFMSMTMYLSIMTPYLFLSLYITIWTLYLRNYKPYYILSAIFINVVTFTVFLKAVVYALLGIESQFVVTPKGAAEPLTLYEIWPQLACLLICVSALVWAGNRVYFEGVNVPGLLGNMFWCAYNLISISFVMYFNNPEGKPWLKYS